MRKGKILVGVVQTLGEVGNPQAETGKTQVKVIKIHVEDRKQPHQIIWTTQVEVGKP